MGVRCSLGLSADGLENCNSETTGSNDDEVEGLDEGVDEFDTGPNGTNGLPEVSSTLKHLYNAEKSPVMLDIIPLWF